MDHARDAQTVCGPDNGSPDKAALGENGCRVKFFQHAFCLADPLQNPARVRQVFQAEVAAEFSGRDSGIGDAGLFRKRFLDPVIGTDIVNLVAAF